MLAHGLLEEARLVYANRDAYHTAAQAIGYKEFFPYFEGKEPLEVCTAALNAGDPVITPNGRLTSFPADGRPGLAARRGAGSGGGGRPALGGACEEKLRRSRNIRNNGYMENWPVRKKEKTVQKD